MFYSKVSHHKYLLRLVRNENVVNSIVKLCEKLNIKNAYITAIGALTSPTIAYYDLKKKKYHKKEFKGDFELTSLIGNIAMFKNKPLLHAHITISDKSMISYGGHLVEAEVGGSMEIIIDVFDTNHDKTFNEEVCLNLWKLPERL